ncbi:MAG: BON domain-containing protein [Bryobacteraceae bacterium]|jgi:osmotically-inducible protein OsmY
MRFLALVLILLVAGLPFAAAQQASNDDQIYDLVRRRLAGDPDVKGGAFEITVANGVVTLKGTVKSEKAKKKADKLTRKVKGVKDVINQLVVKPAGL